MAKLAAYQTLDLTQRKARYGLAYMRAIASQAGCGFAETSPGEDTLAIDYGLSFPEAEVRIQVKTTSEFEIGNSGNELTYTAHDDWIRKWSATRVPIYFVVVVVPNDSGDWLNHDEAGTQMVKTAAYWCRIDPKQFGTSKTIRVSRTRRLAADTFVEWHRDLMECFRGPAA